MTGYKSKRAAAQAKLDDDDTLTIAYQSGFYDGKKAAAQEPTKYSFRANWEADGCIGVVAAIERLDGGVHLLKDTIDAPQPVQEPVAYLCGPDKNGLFGLPTADKACKDCFPVYRQSPQPAQEPVANDRALQLVTYQMNHWRAYALELQERLVKYEGGAPMLLNKEKNT